MTDTRSEALRQLRDAIATLDQAITAARPAHDAVTRDLLRLDTPLKVAPASPAWRRWRIVDLARP